MNIVDKIVQDIKKIKSVKGIYLFGSYAKKKQTPISDIDICVITDPKINEKNRARILSNSSEKIDITLFHDLPPYIQVRLLKEGKPLYETERPLISHIFAMALSNYQEFNPIVHRYYEKAHNIKL